MVALRSPVDAGASVLVVSPHLDDAALSCGALLSRVVAGGGRACVASVFTGLPRAPVPAAAARWHARCGLGEDAILVRRREDEDACGLLGVEMRHLGFAEALYRRRNGVAVYPRDQDVFGPVATADAELEGAIARALAVLGEWDVVLAPLGVGGHVDHTLTRRTLAAVVPARRLLYYEEVPYVLYDRCAGWEAELAVGLTAAPCRVASADWQRKLAAIECYRSQLDVLWERPDTWRGDLLRRASDMCSGRLGERYWRVAPTR